MKVDGRCHCGAIVYEAEVESGTVGVRHCSDCQQLTGSPFRANIQAPAAGFRMLQGDPRRYVHGDSGTARVGALRSRYELGIPARQIWTKRRLSWVMLSAEVAEIEGQPH